MNTASIIYKTLVILGLTLFVVAGVSADSIALPRPYVITQGKYTFVMHTQDSSKKNSEDSIERNAYYKKFCSNKNQTPIEALSEKEKQDIKDRCFTIQVLNRYRQSGMYVKEGANQPLWTIDWYAYKVILASDGEHLMRIGGWAGGLKSEAFSFFRNGKLIASFNVGDLVDNESKLQHSVSHISWKRSSSYDEKNFRYSVATVDGNEYAYDIRSGRIVKSTEQTSPTDSSRDRSNFPRWIEYRMSWGRAIWPKLSDASCDKARFVTGPNVDKVNQLLDQYSDQGCGAGNLGYYNMIKQSGDWALAQPVSLVTAKLVKRIAAIKQSIKQLQGIDRYYEYQLAFMTNTNTNLDGEEGLIKLRDQIQLMEEIRYQSKKNGNKQKAQEYKARLVTTSQKLKKIEVNRGASRRHFNYDQDVEEAENLTSGKMGSIRPDHEYLLSPYIWGIQHFCRNRNPNHDSMRRILNNAILLEKQLHPAGHKHVVQALGDLMDCYDSNDLRRKLAIKNAFDEYVLLEKNGELGDKFSIAFAKSLRGKVDRLFNKLSSRSFRVASKISDTEAKNYKMEIRKLLSAIDETLFIRYKKMGDSLQAFNIATALSTAALQQKEKLQHINLYFNQAKGLLPAIEKRNAAWDLFQAKRHLELLEYKIKKSTAKTNKEKAAVDKTYLARYRKSGNSLRAFDMCTSLASAALGPEVKLSQANYYFNKAKEFIKDIEINDVNWKITDAKKRLHYLEDRIKERTAELERKNKKRKK